MTPAEEAFEIVRRRLFQPIEGEESFASRDAVVKAFSGEYRRFAGDFPSEAGESEYEGRMRASYPIHPELFERLYKDWSALDDFHRMRGLLRLMSALIHTLWEREDEGFMILPGSVPVDADAVHSELIRHLSPAWDRVVGKDIDGADSLPFRIDRANPTLGSCSAARRVARTLYLGSAPNQGGLEEEKIKLGCVQPGEAAGPFADALRNLAGEATHLFADGGRYWYSTQPRT
jgi:predicted AAA+ superfamily ATPase